ATIHVLDTLQIIISECHGRFLAAFLAKRRDVAAASRRYQSKSRKERPVVWPAGRIPGQSRRTLRAALARLGDIWHGRTLIVPTRSGSMRLWWRACRWIRRRDGDEYGRRRETRAGRRPSRREGETRARRSPSQVQRTW
ncbi:hypothetical protein PENTCL1PPCAC_29592, partial [Pristionchus entomophagus]